VFADGSCGDVSSTPVISGQDVQIGCFAQYDWLAAQRYHDPHVRINASIEFLGEPETLSAPPSPIAPYSKNPFSERLSTTLRIRNVQRGHIARTCRVRFEFENRYSWNAALNPLEWNCTVNGKCKCINAYLGELGLQPISRLKHKLFSYYSISVTSRDKQAETTWLATVVYICVCMYNIYVKKLFIFYRPTV